MSELDKHMVVIDADLSSFKRKVADATEDAKRRFRDTAREANAAFAPAGQTRGRSIREKFGPGASSRPQGPPSPIDPNKIEITLPASTRRTFSEMLISAFVGEQGGSLLSAGITVSSTASLIAEAIKQTGRFAPVLGAGVFGFDLMTAGLPQIETSTLKAVLDQFKTDAADLEALRKLSPEERERGGDQLTKDVEGLKRNINDAVVSLGEALKRSAQGTLALRRQNEGAIPDSLIGRANVDEFRALADSLGDISEIVKDPKLQQQIESVLKRQEFIFRTGREPGRVVPDGLGQPRSDERINPLSQKSSFLDLGGGASPRRRQLAGLGFTDLGLDRGAESLAGFAERLAELPGAFVETREQAGGFGSEIEALGDRLGRTNLLFGEQAGLLGELGAQVPELGRAFATLLERTSQDAGTLNDVVGVLGQGFVDAFEGAIQRGESFGDVLKGLARDMAEIALKTAGNSLLQSILGGLAGAVGGGVAAASSASSAVAVAVMDRDTRPPRPWPRRTRPCRAASRDWPASRQRQRFVFSRTSPLSVDRHRARPHQRCR